MLEPLVSIITPAYKAAEYIPETIESVLSQSYKNWEMIIVDDCSPDGLNEVVTTYTKKDKRVKLLCHDVNKGVEQARQTALDHSKGEFIAFLDSDDLWDPNKLKLQVNFMLKKDLAFSYTSYRRMSVSGDKVSAPIKLPNKITYDQLLSNTCIATLTVMLSREKVWPIKFELNTGYDDFVLWLSILKRGHEAKLLDKSLSYYRVMEASISSNKKRALGWVWHILRNIEGLSFFRSLLCLTGYAVRAYMRRKRHPVIIGQPAKTEA